LVVELLLGDLAVSPLCFTVQAEVGDRLLAGPGGGEYGPISIFAQALASGRRIARVPPEAFWPAPKVHSVMLRLDRQSDRPPRAVIEQLTRLVHACFNHRRKTMRSNLRELLPPEAMEACAAAGGWSLNDRPETL